MNKDLGKYRKSYEKLFLDEKKLLASPLALFSNWFSEVEEAGGVEEANAMTLTTIDLDGFPKARIVLLKHFDQEGFVFYTNYTSTKAKSIEQNKQVCISFFWPNLERQVIIKGEAIKVTEEKSNAYFQSRPRGSQLGAWASDQSIVINSRKVLENQLEALEKRFKNKEIPKPEFWGGYCVVPVEYEFWQGRPNRLHDRIRYTIDGNNNWKIERLAP